jgi:hypothetical protein
VLVSTVIASEGGLLLLMLLGKLLLVLAVLAVLAVLMAVLLEPGSYCIRSSVICLAGTTSNHTV